MELNEFIRTAKVSLSDLTTEENMKLFLELEQEKADKNRRGFNNEY